MFYKLLLIRRVEEEITRRYPTYKIKSPVHLSIGQEAVSVGVCEALRPEDIVFGMALILLFIVRNCYYLLSMYIQQSYFVAVLTINKLGSLKAINKYDLN